MFFCNPNREFRSLGRPVPHRNHNVAGFDDLDVSTVPRGPAVQFPIRFEDSEGESVFLGVPLADLGGLRTESLDLPVLRPEHSSNPSTNFQVLGDAMAFRTIKRKQISGNNFDWYGEVVVVRLWLEYF